MSVVDNMLQQLPKSGRPPLHLWQPPLSGQIDITIKSDGSWWHEGTEFKRDSLVGLFASILRFEDEYGYVLVSPVEKWQIQVEDVPFIAVAAEQNADEWRFALKHGEALVLGKEHPLEMRDFNGVSVPYLKVREGLYARLSRPVYYQLAENLTEHGDHVGLWSQGQFFVVT